MSSQTKILFKGGILLIHDSNNQVVPTVNDLLVENDNISQIATRIEADSATRVIDCTSKIVSPGFVDTHRHLYQTQMKGKHADHTFVEYLPSGNFIAGEFSLEDLFWGQLGGALESIDAGTTTVVDVSSCNTTPEHPTAAIQALASAGLRSIYCYAPARRAKSYEPWEVEDDYFSDSTMINFHSLASAAPYANGKIHIGFALDNVYMPTDTIKAYYAKIRDSSQGKAKLITTHSNRNVMIGGSGPSVARILEDHGLLGPDILLAHATAPHDGDGELLKKSGAHMSSTPSTELQMGFLPAALREDHFENASIGIDCHSWTSASIPGEMNKLLGIARYKRQEELGEKEVWSRHTGYTAEQVFNLGTIGGAKAAGLENEIGKLKEGMKADLVVFDGSSPAMVVAAQTDPVGAIICHSSPRDVEFVMVNGVVRKENGRLVDVVVEPGPAGKGPIEVGKMFKWTEIAAQIVRSKRELDEKTKEIDMKKGEDYGMDKFYMNKNQLLEK